MNTDSNPAQGVITVLLTQWRDGNPGAASALMDHVYSELRRLAGIHMRSERADHTLQPTALVHEALIRLIGEQTVDWRNRAHFLALASNVMRRVLVEHARRRNAAKRGGVHYRIEFDDAAGSLHTQFAELLDLDAALCRLAEIDNRLSRVVELRYFGGLSVEEAAEVLEVSPKTVKRDWTLAKAWLLSEVTGS